MWDRHQVTTAQAEEALRDPERVVIQPDYASLSGKSVRVIGYSVSLDRVLSVIVVVEDGVEYGATGFPSNDKDQAIYHGKGDTR